MTEVKPALPSTRKIARKGAGTRCAMPSTSPLTPLQADAYVTVDRDVAGRAKKLVAVAPLIAAAMRLPKQVDGRMIIHWR